MGIFAFVILSVINILLMVTIVRKWSPVSPEGFCMLFLILLSAGDNILLLYHYVFQPGALLLGADEFELRMFPTFVSIVGLLALMAGLWIPRRSPIPIQRDLNPMEMMSVRYIGFAMILIGLVLWIIGIRLTGVGFSGGFYGNLDQASRVQATAAGGFWFRGADMALFGTGMVMASFSSPGPGFFAGLATAMALRFFMNSGKGGIETAIVWLIVIIYVYNRRLFRQFLNLRTAILLLTVALAGFIFKFALRSNQDASLNSRVDEALGVIVERYGDQGLYRGYSQFVSFLPRYQYLFSGYRVGRYTFTSTVPRALWRDKDEHPFRAIGFMINPDFHNFADEHSAPTLMGTAYADNGFYTLIAYMFLAGLFLTWMRIMSAGPKGTIDRHAGLVLYTLMGGFSPEGGIISMIEIIPLSFGTVFLANLLVAAVLQRYSRSLGSVNAGVPVARGTLPASAAR